jgi:hypothetical protein
MAINVESLATRIAEQLDRFGTKDGPVRLALVHEDGGVSLINGQDIGDYLGPLIAPFVASETVKVIRQWATRNTVLVDAEDPQEAFVHTDDLMHFLFTLTDEPNSGGQS